MRRWSVPVRGLDLGIYAGQQGHQVLGVGLRIVGIAVVCPAAMRCANPHPSRPLASAMRRAIATISIAGADCPLRADSVAAPLRSGNGRLVVSGWTAWPYLPGRHEAGRWLEVVSAGRLLHAAFASLPRPAFLRARADWWAAGDRVAWGESPLEPYLDLDTVRDLAAALRPVQARPQLVHGDLTGNVLFHPTLPPAVIDLSPYWRPPAFADAVVVADAMAWEGADAELPALVAPGVPEFGQCFLRALVYRIATDRLAGGDRAHDWQAPYRPAVRIACTISADSGDR